MTAVQITEYTYTATRKYHDFDQSATTGNTPESYDTLTDFVDDMMSGASTGMKALSRKYSAQKQLLTVDRVTGTVPVGKHSILANVHIPNSTEKSQGRTDVTSLAILEKVCNFINDDWLVDEDLDDEGFTTTHPINSTKNNIAVDFSDVTFKNSGTALAATGKLKVDNSYSKITFDKDVVLADAQAAAAAADTMMDNYDIFTQEA